MLETLNLCNQLDDAAGLCDLPLSLLADPTCAHNQWNLWETTLSENLGVTEREKVENWDGVLLGAGGVLLTLLGWDKGPKLCENVLARRPNLRMTAQHRRSIHIVAFPCSFSSRALVSGIAHLVKVDDWLPEVVALLVEVPHSDLSEVTWMVLVHVRSVVVLSTSKTTSTGMLAVLAYTTVTGGDMTAATLKDLSASMLPRSFPPPAHTQSRARGLIRVLRCWVFEDGLHVLLAGLGQMGRHFVVGMPMLSFVVKISS